MKLCNYHGILFGPANLMSMIGFWDIPLRHTGFAHNSLGHSDLGYSGLCYNGLNHNSDGHYSLFERKGICNLKLFPSP